jgi:hypothetical protein
MHQNCSAHNYIGCFHPIHDILDRQTLPGPILIDLPSMGNNTWGQDLPFFDTDPTLHRFFSIYSSAS